MLKSKSNIKGAGKKTLLSLLTMAIPIAGIGISLPSYAQDAEWYGFVENASYHREGAGLSKFRNTLQLEGTKRVGPVGSWDDVTLVGTFRGTFDGVYDMNSRYGNSAGGAIDMTSHLAPPIGKLNTPWGSSAITSTTPEVVLPGAVNGFGFNATDPGAPRYNPNEGLSLLGSGLHDNDQGVQMGVPVRPCDKDSRGCIDGYLDYDSDELRSPEFNDRLDFIREAYIDANKQVGNGVLNVRLGRQQVVWGRTDLFRVLDVLNPVDYSRHNIYDELEDIRIPMWMLNTEYRMGATETFNDLNFSMVWNFDKFRPSNLGQSGTPYQILNAGSFFRAMKNCWDNGCSVSNFAGGAASTDFPHHVIGIRDVHLPDWSLSNTQLGVKVEGDYKGLGFSLNALTYRSHLPSLRAVVDTADNPFTPGVKESQYYPYLIAFDMHFPRVNMIGGSLDYYSDALKSVIRFETSYSTGEEFANTLHEHLYSESDVFRYVIGWDTNVFISALNKNRAFLLSVQLFGQHLLDHELRTVNDIEAGMPDWETNHIGTLLMKGWWMNDRLSPQIIFARDTKAGATTVAPSVEWLINDNMKLTIGANFKTGKGEREFDDCRACNPFPPFTAPMGSTAGPGETAIRGLAGVEPLGRFRAGPIGMAQNEDELQVTFRYRF